MEHAAEDLAKMATCILKVDHSSLLGLIPDGCGSYAQEASLVPAVVAGAIQRRQLCRRRVCLPPFYQLCLEFLSSVDCS
jgi:hypothetical protein